MEIRTVTLSDVENLCPLFSEFFAYNAELQPEYCNASEEDGKYPEVVINDKNADILIATLNDVIVGFVHIVESKTPPYESIVPHNYVEIMAFLVSASCRRKNVGSKLLEAAKLWGKERNLEYIELVALSNAKEANAFYRHCGFEIKSHVMRYTL